MYIGEQLESILGEMHPSDELIVVDDHSEDDTVRVAERVLNECGFNRLSLVRLDRNGGHRAAFARGLSLAVNPLVALSDQDDLWAQDRLSLLALDLKESSADLSFGSLRTFGLGPPRSMLNLSRSLNGRRGLAELLLNERRVGYKYGSACAFRRDAIDLSIPVTTETHENWLIAQALSRNGVHLMPEVVTLRRLHANNLTARRRLITRIAARCRTGMAMARIMHRIRSESD